MRGWQASRCFAWRVALAVLHLTPVGRQMRAVADNPVLAQASGIRSRRVMVDHVDNGRR
jgi:branched-subunit amino acid ABC-type transport system permease component